ncbi:MAG: hypothetical protein JWR63_4282, partial [Conexibacter sp.]|nr:hypothetical protein [Conexibacter sp.]
MGRSGRWPHRSCRGYGRRIGSTTNETVRRVVRDAWGYRLRSARATACVLLPLATLCAAGHPRAA